MDRVDAPACSEPSVLDVFVSSLVSFENSSCRLQSEASGEVTPALLTSHTQQFESNSDLQHGALDVHIPALRSSLVCLKGKREG